MVETGRDNTRNATLELPAEFLVSWAASPALKGNQVGYAYGSQSGWYRVRNSRPFMMRVYFISMLFRFNYETTYFLLEGVDLFA